MSPSDRIFLAGVNSVGKSTVGELLAEFLCIRFFDLDLEAERHTGLTVARLGLKYPTAVSYRRMLARALEQAICNFDEYVVALNPPGLMKPIWDVVKKANGTIFWLHDTPQNILERTFFYGDDNRIIDVKLGRKDKRRLLAEIKDDMKYYRPYFLRAHTKIDIAGGSALQVAMTIYKEMCHEA